MTWADAEPYCVGNFAGHLASYHSAVDMASIYAGVGAPGSCSDDEVWNGLSDQLAENVWVWTDNSDVDFTPWDSDEPNDYGGEDCASNSDTIFNDLNCDLQTQCFICQGKLSCCFMFHCTPVRAVSDMFSGRCGMITPHSRERS